MINPTEPTSQMHPSRVRRAINPIAMASLVLLCLSAGAGDKAGAADAQLSKDDLMAKGEEVYNQT